VAECVHCGAAVGEGSRFCPQCGRRVGEGDTRVLPLPEDETGPVPVEVVQAKPRLYGVTPAVLLLVLAGAAAALSVVFFVRGDWPLGLVLAGAALLLLAFFVETARRRPSGRVTQAGVEALGRVRARTSGAADSLATRGRAMTRVTALRRELRRQASLRDKLLYELGAAVYRGDDQAIETTRGRLEELDRQMASTEAQMQDVVAAARQRIEARRLEVQPTAVVEPGGETPGPGEVTPPEPAVIPEPYPPPDEATPPQPAVIPEPGPAVIPEPAPEPQEPSTPRERA
jgi:zinc-ribbon domain